MDQFHTLGVLFVGAFYLKSPLQIVNHREQRFGHTHAGMIPDFQPLTFNPFAEILEFCARAQQ